MISNEMLSLFGEIFHVLFTLPYALPTLHLLVYLFPVALGPLIVSSTSDPKGYPLPHCSLLRFLETFFFLISPWLSL